MPSPPEIVAFSGNSHRPSRSRALAELIGKRIQRYLTAELTQWDVFDAGPGLGAAFDREQLSAEAAGVLAAVERADILVISTPVYKGSYPGLFKHLIDFVEPEALLGKPVVIAATGGGPRHTLVVEHQLRPLFGFFSALTIPTAIYAEDASFGDEGPLDPLILARVELAAMEAATLYAAQHRGELPSPEDMPPEASAVEALD